MIQNTLKEVGGIGLFGVVSICLFCLVFTGVIIRACFLSKATADSLGSLPLNDGTRKTGTIEQD